MSEIITLENLGMRFADRAVFSDLNLQVNAGDFIGITGPVGSGKSTLLRSINGLTEPTVGSVRVFGLNPQRGDDLQQIRRRSGYLFQDADDQLFCATVAEDLAFGPLNQGVEEDELNRRIESVLEILGLEGYQNRIIHHLSGGEKRLVALATVLVMQPELLLLDEPFSSLDDRAAGRVSAVLSAWQGTVVMISHEHGRHVDSIDRWYRLTAGEFEPC